MKASKILVPIEQSTWNEGFVAHLNQMCSEQDCDLILLHIISDLLEINQQDTESSLARAEKFLDDCANQLSISRERIKLSVEMGNTQTLIPQRAITEHVDLIAMATHARTGVNRIIEGSIAESVMRVAHCPTFLCHAGTSPRKSSKDRGFRILVPLEAKRSASETLSWVKNQIPTENRELILYHAYAGDSEFDASRADSDKEHAFMLQCKTMLTDEGYNTTSISASFNNPSKDIAEKVDELEVDLIIMATHGRSGLSRLLFGSVTEAVLQKSDCPLLVLSLSPTHEAEYRERYIG